MEQAPRIRQRSDVGNYGLPCLAIECLVAGLTVCIDSTSCATQGCSRTNIQRFPEECRLGCHVIAPIMSVCFQGYITGGLCGDPPLVVDLEPAREVMGPESTN